MNNQTLYEILGYLLRYPQAVMPSATFDNPYLRLTQGPIPPAQTKQPQDSALPPRPTEARPPDE